MTAPIAPTLRNAKPWYREPWPWLLMAGPAVVVAAGAVTAWLAVTSSDGLVADDYYKQGLAINRTLERDDHARTMGLRADMVLDTERTRVTAKLSSAKHSALPQSLKLQFAHPAKAGLDHVIQLEPKLEGGYAGAMPRLASGRWRLLLEDEQRTWRLVGEWRTGAQSVILSAK